MDGGTPNGHLGKAQKDQKANVERQTSSEEEVTREEEIVVGAQGVNVDIFNS